jgi:hypothetical protein
VAPVPITVSKVFNKQSKCSLTVSWMNEWIPNLNPWCYSWSYWLSYFQGRQRTRHYLIISTFHELESHYHTSPFKLHCFEINNSCFHNLSSPMLYFWNMPLCLTIMGKIFIYPGKLESTCCKLLSNKLALQTLSDVDEEKTWDKTNNLKIER